MKSMRAKVIFCAIVLSVTLVVLPVIARGPTRPAGKSNVGHLYLVEKVPSGEWPVVEDGAWGKMKYNLSGSTFDFVFNGHGLEPDTDYTLIYYPDKDGNPWPREDIMCLGEAAADEEGNVHIKGSEDTGDLPNPETDINEGAKIWLVLSRDVDCDENEMFGWDPTRYLFEYDLINFDDTDDNQE
ncbi:MAG: hypothetical protein ACYS76_10655 [Planctomycetota bacterium]